MSLHALWCKALLQRYLGTWLETRLSMDQMSVDLANGLLELEHLEVNSKEVNRALKKSNIPVKLTDGYLGAVRLNIQWLGIMTEPTEMSVEDLQLTFQTDEDGRGDVEKATSMISSVLTALTQETVSQNVLEHVSDKLVDLLEDGTADTLANLVKTLSAKFCVTIKNVTIRFENAATSELGTAVEVRIEEIKFVDGQMLDGSAPRNSKNLLFRGVSLYTDVFSKMPAKCGEENDGELGTSMHIRREKANAMASMYASAVSDNEAYHSCYEQLSQECAETPEVLSDPIKIAEVIGEVRCTMREDDVKMEVTIGKLHVFGTPSQFEILKRFASSITSQNSAKNDGKPMTDEDFEMIEKYLEVTQTSGNMFREFEDLKIPSNVEPEREELDVHFHMGSLLLIIPHEDPLSTDFCLQNRGFVNARDVLKREATEFFEEAESSFGKDHLRVSGRSVKVQLGLESLEVVSDRFEILEVLHPAEREEPVKVPLLLFPKHEQDPDVKITLRSNESLTELDVVLRAVRSELDVSILDRISNLILPTPFFDESTAPPRKPSTRSESEVELRLKCMSWQIDLLIPKEASNPFAAHQRQLHEEFLRFGIKDIEVTVKKNWAQMLCGELNGDFCGSDVSKRQKRFLQAGGSEKVSLKVVRNSEPLKMRKTCPMASSSILTAPATEEGPFSKIPRSYISHGSEKIEIIQAGSRSEILEFQGNCQQAASIILTVDVPILKVHVPEKKHLELFFNRLINDLAAFTPSSAKLRTRTREYPESFDSDEQEATSNDFNTQFDRSVPHAFSLNVNARKCTVLCNTAAFQVAFDLRNAHIGTTTGYHGDVNNVFFHLTSSKVAVGASEVGKGEAIPNDICSKTFGKWTKEMSQIEHVSKTFDDSLAVAVRLHLKPDFNTKDVLLAVALRNSELKARPFKSWNSCWMGQLAELFDLQDYSDAELPRVTNRVHVNLENAFIGYDHSWLKPESHVKLMVAIGKCNVSTSIVSEARIVKSMWMLENCRLSMNQNGQFVRFLDIGSVQMEILSAIGREEDPAQRSTPAFEIRCRNDLIRASACADSLAIFIKTMNELLESEQDDEVVEREKRKKRRTLSEEAEKRIRDMIEDAVRYEEDVVAEDVGFGSRRSSDEMEDDGFCLVNRSCFGSAEFPESHVRIKAGHLENFSLNTNCFKVIDEIENDQKFQAIGGGYIPAFRYFLKNFSLELELYAGNDFSAAPTPPKSYSSREFSRSRGGRFRDHSAFVTLELKDITYFKQIFEKTAPFLSTTLLEIKDVVGTNHLKASEIRGMLYQYTSTEKPSRTNSPLVSIRMMESPTHEAKMRVSMQDVKLNVDQDTLEFLSDFYEETSGLLGLETSSKAPIAHRLPTMNAPEMPTEMSSWPLRPTALVQPAPIGDLSYLENWNNPKQPISPSADDDILMRSTMMGSIYPTLIDTEDLEADNDGPYPSFLDGIDDEPSEEEEDDVVGHDDSSDDSSDTYFTRFVFAPAANIFVDYHGNQKMSVEQCGTLFGIFKTFGQLTKVPIELQQIDTRSGLLGVGQCLSYAAEQWLADLENIAPRVLASVGPLTPLFDVGKGVVDLFAMPVREFQKEDGSVVMGVQRGVGSFGVSSATGLVGIAQTVTGLVQNLAELTIKEVQVTASEELPNRRRYNSDANSNPTDLRQGLQQAYGTLHDGYHRTRSDLELASREHRSSVVRSAFRFAVPTVLTPVVMITQATNQIIGGFRNQLRPDEYKDEMRKWGKASTSRNVEK